MKKDKPKIIGWIEDIKASKVIIATDINYNRCYFYIDKNMFIDRDRFSIQQGYYVEELANRKYRTYLDPRPIHVQRREFNKAMEKAKKISEWLKSK